MKAVLLFTIFSVLGFASSLPSPAPNDTDGCLVMTPNRQNKLEYIENQISELLSKLEHEIGDLLITDVAVTIKKYTKTEADKDIYLGIFVNDCVDATKTNEEPAVNADVQESDKDLSSNDTAESNSHELADENNNVRANENTAVRVRNENLDDRQINKELISSKSYSLRPVMEVMMLHLNEKEDKMVREVESKRGRRPFLLIERSTGEREIKFI